MSDIAFLLVSFFLVLATMGLVSLCQRLMKQ